MTSRLMKRSSIEIGTVKRVSLILRWLIRCRSLPFTYRHRRRFCPNDISAGVRKWRRASKRHSVWAGIFSTQSRLTPSLGGWHAALIWC